MKVAIMQPYIFPYIGYFQLIHAVDSFVFYDDVNFIKRGWINRNRILIDGDEKLISFPCIKASQNKLINEVKINLKNKEYNSILKTIYHAYKNTPKFKNIYPIIESILQANVNNISELAILSIKKISHHLDINTDFLISSHNYSNSKGMDKADRLIYITKELKSDEYINAFGGRDIYSKKYFRNNRIELQFLKPIIKEYNQNTTKFTPNLSIIDVLMFNDKSTIKNIFLNSYELI